MTQAVPPIVSGSIPVLGHVVEMLRDRDGLFKRGHAEHGDLFTIKLANQYAVVVTGAEHNKTFYTETDKSLNMQEGYTFLKEAIGEVLFTANSETYYNQRPALQEVFKRERMVGYIDAMNIEIQRWLDGLGQSGEIDITQEMLRLTQYVAGRALIGPNFEAELGQGFWDEYQAISASLDPVLPPTLPLPKFWRRDKAKAKISAVILSLIERRRANPDQYDDLISTLLTTPMKDGTIMADETIVTMFMGLIFAGHETTAGQAAWLVALVLRHPEYRTLVQNEIRDHVAYGAPIDAATLSKLDHIYWAIDETTRLRPSADTQLRTVEAPLNIGGYDIPKGWRVMVSGVTSHFIEGVYNDAQQFDPLRYSPDRAEGKNPFNIIGFGGGIHKCTGMNFAKNEMAIILSLFLQQFDLELLSKEIHVVTGNGANHPSEVRVRYKRKPLSELTSADTIRDAAAAGCPHVSKHLKDEQQA